MVHMDESIFQMVKSAVEELADELGFDGLRIVSAETPLFGGDNGVDSLTLVRLIAEVERLVEDRFGNQIVLADERAMSRRNSPFRTVGSFCEFVQERLATAHD
jgi:acyl carrier protein